jgi:ABC-type multidrug transport system ATPase subunit
MEKGKIIAFDTPANLKKRFFEQKPLELTFLKPLQNEIKREIEKRQLAGAAVFGGGLRLAVNNMEKFKEFARERKDDFTFKESEATLEDVFLKALVRRAEENNK